MKAFPIVSCAVATEATDARYFWWCKHLAHIQQLPEDNSMGAEWGRAQIYKGWGKVLQARREESLPLTAAATVAAVDVILTRWHHRPIHEPAGHEATPRVDAKAHVLELGIGCTRAPYLRNVTLVGTDTATWIDDVITSGSKYIWIWTDEWWGCPRVWVGSIVSFSLPFSNGNCNKVG